MGVALLGESNLDCARVWYGDVDLSFPGETMDPDLSLIGVMIAGVAGAKDVLDLFERILD